MSTAVITNGNASIASRQAILEDGTYALVGFKDHKFTVDGKERLTKAPVVARIEAGQAVALFMVNRTDFLNTKEVSEFHPNRAPGELAKPHRNTGTFVTFVSNIVNVEGPHPDARWLNVLMPQVANKIFKLACVKFAGTSRKGTEYKAHVYNMDEEIGTLYTPNYVQLQQLAQQKGWDLNQLHRFDGQPTVFTDKNGVTIQFDANGKLASELIKDGNGDWIVKLNS